MAESSATILPIQPLRPHGAKETSALTNNRFSGGSGGGPVDHDTQSYIDRSMDAVRAQNDARFAEIGRKIDILSIQVGSLPSAWKMAGIIATAFSVALGLVFAILSFAGDRFDGGMAVGSVNDAISEQNADAISLLIANNNAQNRRIDQILNLLETGKEPAEE